MTEIDGGLRKMSPWGGLALDSIVRRIGFSIKLYVGLEVLRPIGANSEGVGDSRKIGQGPSSHFSHYMAAMNLYRNLADPQLRGNQFVHHAGSNEGQNVALAGRQRLVQPSQI